MTTPLFLLRCKQLGLTLTELDLLTIGIINDMFTERQNDDYPYKELASQSDFDRFYSKKTGDRAYVVNEISTIVW